MHETEFEELHSLLETANKLLKTIRQRHSEKSIITANEQLRYAGCHLSRAVKFSFSLRKLQNFHAQLDDAKAHCLKAMNYAFESGIRESVAVIQEFPKDFGDTILPDLIEDYADIKKHAVLASDFTVLDDLNRPCEEYKSHYDTVYDDRLRLVSFREELTKKAAEYKRNRRLGLITVVVAFIAATGAFLGGVGNFYKSFFAKDEITNNATPASQKTPASSPPVPTSLPMEQSIPPKAESQGGTTNGQQSPQQPLPSGR